MARSPGIAKKAAKPKTAAQPKEIELHPDAWERFEEGMSRIKARKRVASKPATRSS